MMKRNSKLMVLPLCLILLMVSFSIAACNNDKPIIEEVDSTVRTVQVGQTYSITPKYKSSTFSSQNISIATVTSSGTVYGVKIGNAEILEKTDSVTVKYTINVIAAEEEEDKNVYTITLDKTEMSMVINSSYTLTARVYANGLESSEKASWSIEQAHEDYTATNVLTLENTDTNQVLVKSKAGGKANVRAKFNTVTVDCIVTVESENFAELPLITEIVDPGKTITWGAITSATTYFVSDDEGKSWVENKSRSYIIREPESPESYSVWVKSVGNGVEFGDSVKKITVRTKRHLILNQDSLDFISDGSSRYDLYVGSTCHKQNILSGDQLDALLATGDYSITIRNAEGKESNAADYKTKQVNPNEINSYNSSRDAESMTAPHEQTEYAAKTKLSSDFKRGESGYSLSVQSFSKRYNNYCIRTYRDLTNITNIYFYLYVDSGAILDGDGNLVEKDKLPVPVLSMFIMDNGDYTCTIASGETLGYDKWVRIEGVKKADRNPVNSFTLTADAFALEPTSYYYSTFYIDDVYIGVNSDIAIEDDKIVYTTTDMTYNIYDGKTGVLVKEKVANGYDISSDVIVAATSEHPLTVKIFSDDVQVGIKTIYFKTKLINPNEINSYNSSRDAESMTAPHEQADYAANTKLSSNFKRGESGYSLSVQTFSRQYNNYCVRTYSDLTNITNIYFYLYVDSGAILDGDGNLVEKDKLPVPVLSMFVMDNGDYTCSVASGETLGYDKWVRIEGVKKTERTTLNSFTLTADANALGTYYYSTFYIDDVYRID